MKSEVLPAIVRVKILEGRLNALDAGAGEYTPEEREDEVLDCLTSLAAAALELGAGRA